MTLLESPNPVAAQPASARWAWIAVALVPVWFAGATVLAMLLGDSQGNTPHVLAGSIYALAVLAVPFAALFMSLHVRRAGAKSGTAAVVTSAVLLALASAGLLLIVSSEAFLVAAGVCVAATAIGIALTGRTSGR